MLSSGLTRGSLYGILDFSLGILEFLFKFAKNSRLGILDFSLGILEFLGILA